MVVNTLRKKLPRGEWVVTVVEPSAQHYYQPGFLFLPFGALRARDVVKPTRPLLARDIHMVSKAVDRVDPEAKVVHLDDGTTLAYDYLVIATGTSPRPDQTPGMSDGMGSNVHEFYTYAGAMALAAKLADWPGGRLVVHVTEMPIKCPVAPLEFAFLAAAHLAEGDRPTKVEITYATPLPGAFTQPISTALLGTLLRDRGITVEPDFVVESVDATAGTITSFDGRELPFDLLVTIPVNMGADYVARSGLGDELNYVPVDKHTLLSSRYDTIFAIGDASDIPASKAGSVAHFAVESFVPNFLAHVEGRPMTHSFDGHANCFIESGHGKGLLIDFNYDTEPLPGTYPLPGVGPLRLLRESRLNHWGKLAFRQLYWHVLLPGLRLPVSAHMSMAGKHPPHEASGTPAATASGPRIPTGLD
jgi:sulfide:quinone oxidoreductase